MEFSIVFSYLRRPVAPALGMVCQYLFMPLMAYIIGLLMLKDAVWARYGLIMVGCSPGGSGSNFWTAMFGGDLNLSITMTFCSTVASFAFTTFWLWFFAKYVLTFSGTLQLPYVELLISLIFLIVPVLLGMLLKHKKPDTAAKVMKSTRPFLAVILVGMAVLGTYTNRFFFSTVNWYHFVAPMTLGLCGYICGIVGAFLLCLKKEQVIALSLETAMQNATIAVLILQTNLESPYGDMALLAVIGYMLTRSINLMMSQDTGSCCLVNSMGPLNVLVFLLYKTVLFVKDRITGGSSNEKRAIDSELANHNTAYTGD